MRVADLLQPEAVRGNVPVRTKEEALETLLALLEATGCLSDPVRFQEDVREREREGGTALTDGVAIPHAKSPAVLRPTLAVLTAAEGIPCGSLDGKPTDLFFLIAVPEEEDLHIEVLSALSGLLIDPGFREALRHAGSPEALLRVFQAWEGGGAAGQDGPAPPEKTYRVLAVTACPTGVAHTYMAAEGLRRAADELGCSLKVETDGAGGVDHALTEREIEAAECIVVASDRAVDMERFIGKPVLRASVGEGVHHPEKLLEKAVSGTVAVYTGEKDGGGPAGEPVPHRIYRHLMNGVSHMMPLVVAGGVLIALSYLLDDYRLGAATLGRNTQPAEFLNLLGSTAFGFMLPVLSAFIAQSIADRPGLAAGFVGGLLAKQGVSFLHPSGAVSAGFLGALLAGFAAGYLVRGLKWATRWMPARMDSVRTILLYPVFGVLLAGGAVLAVNPFLSSLNTAFTHLLDSMGKESGVVLGVVLGAVMAVDMGGPLSKSAYVFGTVAIAAGDYDIMAAVMVGGMVPPLATALASTFFPAYFSEQERKNGVVNYVLGLCFISEGAIPFAAADPLRVIPACMLGSALAGGLSMAFGCTLIAPHGGAFVFPLVGNLALYLVALCAGSLCGMAALVLLKAGKSRRRKTGPVGPGHDRT